MANLRAGLIGLGMMGRHHARVLASLPGVDLVAVADPGGDLHAVGGGRPIEADVEALLRHGMDYCVVAVPTVHHEEIGLTLAAAGVHALVEKPLAEDTAAAARVARAFADRDLVGAVGHIERYNPALQQARGRIAAGELGEVYQVVTRRQGPFPDRVSDVGVVKDLGTHDIDLTAWVTQQDFVSVAARTAHRSGREHEDMVSVVGQLSGGTITNHLINWLTPFKERVTVITGENGTYVADTLSADLTYYANGTTRLGWDALSKFRGVSEGDVIRYAIVKPEPLRTEHEQFRNAVLGQDADIVSMDHGVRTVRVAEACIRSSVQGVSVDL